MTEKRVMRLEGASDDVHKLAQGVRSARSALSGIKTAQLIWLFDSFSTRLTSADNCRGIEGLGFLCFWLRFLESQ